MRVYNGDTYLREAIESILWQTYQDFELVIVDDGSTDASVEIVNSYSDWRIRLLCNPTNLGPVGAINAGLELAAGEFVAVMDCDDISLPDRLEAQVRYLERHQKVGILGSSVRLVDESGSVGDTIHFPETDSLIRWSMCLDSPMAHPTVMMRTDLVRELNGYSSEVILGREEFGSEDYDLWRRASKVTHLANIAEVLLHLRKHGRNLTVVHSLEHMRNSSIVRQLVISELLGESPDQDLMDLLGPQSQGQYASIRSGANLLLKLYEATVSDQRVPRHERNTIRRATAMQLVDAARPFIGDIRVWNVVLSAWKLDPIFPVRLILRSMRTRLRGGSVGNL